MPTAQVDHARPERSLDADGSASRPARWSLSPGQRKLALAAHVVVSVGLFGVYAAMFALATIAATTSDPETTGAAYRSLGLLKGIVPPAAVGVIVTGAILSLGTSWGLFKHLWIVVKLGLTVAALPVSILTVFPAVQRAITATSRAGAIATPDLGDAPLVLTAASGAVVLMLGAATVIAVYKPWGLIGRARRASASASSSAPSAA
jgi:hypothetical protein